MLAERPESESETAVAWAYKAADHMMHLCPRIFLARALS